LEKGGGEGRASPGREPERRLQQLGGVLPFPDHDRDYRRLFSFASRRRNSMYSHTRVTITPKAPYHSIARGAPRAAPFSMKSKSSTRLSAATTTTNRLKPMPTSPL